MWSGISYVCAYYVWEKEPLLLLLLLLWFFTNRKLDFFSLFLRSVALHFRSPFFLDFWPTNFWRALGLCATFSFPIDHFLMLEVDDWALLTVWSSELTRKRQLFFAQSESSKSNRLCSTPKRSSKTLFDLNVAANGKMDENVVILSWNFRAQLVITHAMCGKYLTQTGQRISDLWLRRVVVFLMTHPSYATFGLIKQSLMLIKQKQFPVL